MKDNEFTTTQVARRFNVQPITVRLWCRRGLFPNAYEDKTPRGPVWAIPESDLEGFHPPMSGRPRKKIIQAAQTPIETERAA
jgi:hypothetical protein